MLLGPGVSDGDAGVFHYRPDHHALERRAAVTEDVWHTLAGGLPDGSFCAAITSIAWREAWKYGERAFRYCQHDTGHAVAALRIAAAMIGWHVRVVPGWNAAALAAHARR